MLSALHAAVRRLIHDHGQVSADEVDVRFDAPRREWIATLTRPTLSFFLFDVQENTELRQTGLESSRVDGRAVHRVPPRRFDLRYMVSALTTVVEDEHLLLWRTLQTLLRHPALPDTVLAPELRALDPAISASVGQCEDENRLLDVWSGLESAPRPALLYVMTVPVDLQFVTDSPLVLTRTVRYARTVGHAAGDAGPVDLWTHIGGVVRDARGTPQADAQVTVEGSAGACAMTRADGTFALHGVPRGAVTLRVSRPGRAATLATIAIPSDSYEVVVD
ncbi:MAG: Pvc16 family protein [Gemmatirosa sp.]